VSAKTNNAARSKGIVGSLGIAANGRKALVFELIFIELTCGGKQSSWQIAQVQSRSRG
jgi:hypothetical protein